MQLKKHLRRVLVFIGATVLLLGLTMGLLVWRIGTSSIQDWIGSQIQGVANGYLNPQLSFTNLSYTYPLAVSLKNLHLTADDPANPGHKIDIVACDEALLALGEIPRIGKPIIIEKISLKSPLISAIAVEPRSKQFVGFSNLIKGGGTTVTEDKKPAAAPQKLSDVFRMRKVELIDGKIVYDPRIPGTVPMSIDQINTGLDITHADASWYKLNTAISRKPVFDLSVLGEFNLDTFAVRGLDLHLMTDLGVEKARFLPPELQEILHRYQAKGKLDVAVTGDMPVMDFMKGNVHATVNLDGANVATGDFHLPVDGVSLDATFADGKATLPSLKINALGGSADLTGAVTLNDRLDADLHVKVVDMVLEKLLADPSRMSPAPAKLNFDFNLAASLMSLIGKAPSPPGKPLGAISLQNFRLTANDPTSAGQTIDVVACKNLAVSMTTPVVSGKPIIVDKVILDQPTLSAVAVAPGSIQFAGVPLVPTIPKPPGPLPLPADAALPSNGPVLAPGDMFRVKEFQLNAAKIVYDPRIANTQRMVIDPIDTSLHLSPDDPGVYAVDVNIGRAPVFNLALNGNINIDHPGLEKLKLTLLADLQQHQLDFLPPQLQLVLQQTHAHGKLNINADATMMLSDPTHGSAAIDLNVANLDFAQGNVHVPIESLAVSAKLADGKLTEAVRLAALQNVFELDGSSTLNSRLDTDAVLKLKDLNIEKLLSTLHPDRPVPKTSTVLNADIELQSPAMIAISQFPARSSQPVGTVSVHNFRLTTKDPLSATRQLDFVSCDLLEAALSSLPAPGKPIDVHHVRLLHPAIRAVATGHESKDFAGFVALQHLADSPATPSTQPATTTPSPSPKPSALVRLHTLTVDNAELYYNPWIYGSAPMSLTGINTKLDLDSPAGDAYLFTAAVPADPDLHVDVSGRINVDTHLIDPVKLAVAVKFDPAKFVGVKATSFPPQLQTQLQPLAPEGTATVAVDGRVPLDEPMAADLAVNIKADNVKLTSAGYRIPVDHVRIPIRVQNQKATFVDAKALGGPTVSMLEGIANVTGVVQLDQFLTSNLKLQTDGILLQALMATKIQKPAPDLVGAVELDLNLKEAPLLLIAAHATPPPGPNDPPSKPSPLKAIGLPVNWGSMHLEMNHARLAGLEIVQGIGNLAKTAFANVFNRADADTQRTVEPHETAEVAAQFEHDNVHLTLIHYEGEVVGADGKGFITLDQHLNLDITGGPQAKLAELGGVGAWVKSASDSLLYYHVSGTVNDFHIEARRGDGQPIVSGAKVVAKQTGKVVGQGIDQAKHFLGNVFKH